MTDYTTLRSQAADLFKAWLQKLVDINSLDDAQQEYQQATGYITGLNRLGILNDVQYAAMISLLGSAMDAKKAAPSAANTESDKEKPLNFSLEQKDGAVKPRADAFVHADIYGSDMHMEMYGAGRNLLVVFSALASDLKRNGIPGSEIFEACLNGILMERKVKPEA